MERHKFKVIYSSEDDVYRILDLTDTSIVGRTEMFDDFFDYEREQRIEYYKQIKSKQIIGAKVGGYGIFIFLDEDNTPAKSDEDDYLRTVLRQMAAFFKEEVIDNKPKDFTDYIASRGGYSKTKEKTERKDIGRWLKGWRLVVLIVSAAIIIGYIICLIIFPAVRKTTLDFLAIVLGLPLLIILFLAYADDMFARR